MPYDEEISLFSSNKYHRCKIKHINKYRRFHKSLLNNKIGLHSYLTFITAYNNNSIIYLYMIHIS